MTLDNLTPKAWPTEIGSALEKWRQGHLISGNLGVWIAHAGIQDPVTGDDVPAHESGLAARADDVGDTGYMVIISQTCDIGISGPGRRHPMVQVSPVRDLSAAGYDSSKIHQIRDGKVNEYVLLTRPPVEGAVWAADLRISLPVSKGVLVATEPIAGFATVEDELILGARVASKFRRPALPDVIATGVVGELSRFLAKAQAQEWFGDVEQVRLEILEGTPLFPKRVRLMAITDVGLTWLQKRPLTDLWNRQKKALKNAGIQPAPLAFRTLDKWSIEHYRESIPIDLPELGRGRFI